MRKGQEMDRSACITVGSVREKVAPLLEEAVRLRHELHRIPELAMEEHRTREAVLSALAGLPLRIREPLLGTDIVAELDAGCDETVCLRADMDALPLVEATGVPYASESRGRMHACGHDGHMAILVGCAKLLCQFREQLPRNVRFVFQPGEEVRCAGRDLVAQGCCDGTSSAFALHGWGGLPVGHVATKPGILMAAGGFFSIRLRGRGCHGAMPEAGNNPIPVAGAAAMALAELHREVNRECGAVISVCSVHGGQGSNVIPEEVMMLGTVRYLERPQIDALELRIAATVESAAAGTGVSVAFDLERTYDQPVVNGQVSFDRLAALAGEALPRGAFSVMERPSMGNEDFAYYLEGREGLMFRLGLGEDQAPLHSPGFDFNDEAIGSGILMMCLLAAMP